MTEKAATEEELRKSYKERPEHIPKKIWRLGVRVRVYECLCVSVCGMYAI